MFKASGSSSNPCSDIYAGALPASEAEIKAVTKYILDREPRWVAYFGLHSYGQYWLAPFSYSIKKIPENFKETVNISYLYIYTVFEFAFQRVSLKALILINTPSLFPSNILFKVHESSISHKKDPAEVQHEI